MQAFGWTWEYVDELDLPRVEEIYRGFSRRPPVHWIAASFVKFEPTAASGGAAQAAGGLKPQDMFASLGNQLLDG